MRSEDPPDVRFVAGKLMAVQPYRQYLSLHRHDDGHMQLQLWEHGKDKPIQVEDVTGTVEHSAEIKILSADKFLLTVCRSSGDSCQLWSVDQDDCLKKVGEAIELGRNSVKYILPGTHGYRLMANDFTKKKISVFDLSTGALTNELQVNNVNLVFGQLMICDIKPNPNEQSSDVVSLRDDDFGRVICRNDTYWCDAGDAITNILSSGESLKEIDLKKLFQPDTEEFLGYYNRCNYFDDRGILCVVAHGEFELYMAAVDAASSSEGKRSWEKVVDIHMDDEFSLFDFVFLEGQYCIFKTTGSTSLTTVDLTDLTATTVDVPMSYAPIGAIGTIGDIGARSSEKQLLELLLEPWALDGYAELAKLSLEYTVTTRVLPDISPR
jgi:hypothetical protein